MNPRSLIALIFIFATHIYADSKPPVGPHLDQLHELYAQGNYTELLKQLRAVMPQTDPKSPDRFDLLKLRGETLLHLKSDSEAADAFREAAKIARSDEQASPMRAMDFLLRQSHAEAYTPKSNAKSLASTQPATPISIVEPTSRKLAFAALLDDELEAKSHEIDAAKKATSLVPILNIAPTLGILEDVERAATGSTEKTGAFAKAVGDRARELITSANTKMTHRIDELEKKAGQNEFVAREKGKRTTRRRGLTLDEAQELRQIGSTCDEITTGCTGLHKDLREAGGDFAGLAASVAETRKRAEQTAKKDGPNIGAGN